MDAAQEDTRRARTTTRVNCMMVVLFVVVLKQQKPRIDAV